MKVTVSGGARDMGSRAVEDLATPEGVPRVPTPLENKRDSLDAPGNVRDKL